MALRHDGSRISDCGIPCGRAHFVAMANPHNHPTALKDLQDSIYREKVLRARAMTPEERLDAGFELTNLAFDRMLEGAMWKIGTSDPSEGREELKAQLARLRRADEHGRYTGTPPETARP